MARHYSTKDFFRQRPNVGEVDHKLETPANFLLKVFTGLQPWELAKNGGI